MPWTIIWAFSPPPAWENWLKALNQAVPSLQQERVIWILKPDLERLECKVQKMSAKGGWTQGRSIDHWHIHRLDDSVLDKFDQEILYYLPEYHYSLPVEVLEVLSRHPRLFNEAGDLARIAQIADDAFVLQPVHQIQCVCPGDLRAQGNERLAHLHHTRLQE